MYDHMPSAPRLMSILFIVAFMLMGPSMLQAQDRTAHHTWHDDDHRIEIKARGEVEINQQDEIQSIEQNGYLEIEEEKHGRRQTILISPGSGGSMEYIYREQGREREIDARAQTWIDEMILRYIRVFGINASERVARLLREGGVDGVLREIDLIPGNSGKTRYFIALVEQGNLSDSDLKRVANRVTSDISSSSNKSRFLETAAPYYFHNEGTADAFLKTTASISSSSNKSRVLIHLLEEDMIGSTSNITGLLTTARTISSSSNKSRVLRAVPSRYLESETVQDAYFETLNSISSSGNRTRILQALLKTESLTPATLVSMCNSARKISSSGDKSRFLRAAAPHYINDDLLREAYFRAINTISSSGDHARVLMALPEATRLDNASVMAALVSAKKINSSGNKKRVLLKYADLVAGDDDLVAAYLDAAETISSSGDRERALSALLQ